MATSATETAKQENGSRVFFESVIEKNKIPIITATALRKKPLKKSGKWSHCLLKKLPVFPFSRTVHKLLFQD